MAANQRNWVSISVFLLLLFVLGGLGAGAGYVWWQERAQRLQAEQAVQDMQGKYDRLKQECDAMKLGTAEGMPLNQSGQPPAVAAVEARAEAPRCERPTLQPFTESLRKQDAKFFEKTKEGDVLVIYPQSKIVYVFRQSTNEIVTQATIADPTIQTDQQKPSAGLSLQGVTQNHQTQ